MWVLGLLKTKVLAPFVFEDRLPVLQDLGTSREEAQRLLQGDDSVAPVLEKVFGHLGVEEKARHIEKYHEARSTNDLDMPSEELQAIWDSIAKHDSDNANELSDVNTQLRRQIAKRIQTLRQEVRRARRQGLPAIRAARKAARGSCRGRGRGSAGRTQLASIGADAPVAAPTEPCEVRGSSFFDRSRGVRGVSLAPTGRAVCRLCDLKLAKDAPRVEISFETRRPPGYAHMSCLPLFRARHPELVEASLTTLQGLTLSGEIDALRHEAIAKLTPAAARSSDG